MGTGCKCCLHATALVVGLTLQSQHGTLWLVGAAAMSAALLSVVLGGTANSDLGPNCDCSLNRSTVDGDTLTSTSLNTPSLLL